MAISGPGDDELGPTVARDPLIGALLGEYRVLSRLGAGTMGVVYRGEQEQLGKAVAIKVLKAEASDPLNVQRLLEEARAVTAAHHPNIIDIFSFGQAPTGRQYFVMECLEGEPLDIWLRERGKPSLEEIVKVLEQLVAGLGAAHTAGVIHRDLKPSNIFLARLSDGSRFVKILDFGLAKRGAPNSGIRTTSIVGTPLYMAPEQANGEDIGPWTDLYALGCIAYELLSGTPPFIGPSVVETLRLHATLVPPRLTTLDPTIPRELDALVFELLEKVPARRPRSAALVRRSLDRITRQLSTARTRSSGMQAIRETSASVPTQIDHLRAGPVPQRGQPVAPTTEVSLRRRGSWRLAAVPVALAAAAGALVLLWPAEVGPVPASAIALVPPPALVPAPASATVTGPEPLLPPAARPALAVSEAPAAPSTPRPRPPRPVRAGPDLEKRLKSLRARVRAELTDTGLVRAAQREFDEVEAALDQRNETPAELSSALDDLERKYLGGN